MESILSWIGLVILIESFLILLLGLEWILARKRVIELESELNRVLKIQEKVLGAPVKPMTLKDMRMSCPDLDARKEFGRGLK